VGDLAWMATRKRSSVPGSRYIRRALATRREPDVRRAWNVLAERTILAVASHVPSVVLFALSILLHQLKPYVQTESPKFNLLVEAVVYVAFTLGLLHVVRTGVSDLLPPALRRKLVGEE
jgi:hypothetical protein